MKNFARPPLQRLLLGTRITLGGYRHLKALAGRRRLLALNGSLGGTLLFDGERIAELLVAPAPMLDAAWSDLCKDSGFQQPAKLYRDDFMAPGPVDPWHYGYCEPHDLDAVLGPVAPATAIDTLMAVAARVDLSP